MSRRTLLLILALFLVTCGLLYVAIATTPGPKKVVELPPTPTPIPKLAHTTLSLTTASASESSTTSQHTLAVAMDTVDNKVNAVQLELAYDPKVLTNVTIAPGTFFQQPTTLLKTIDTENGRISYALAEQLNLGGHTGQGTVALISFDIAPTATGKSTIISFLPKSAVSADGIIGSILEKTMDYTVTVPMTTGAASR